MSISKCFDKYIYGILPHVRMFDFCEKEKNVNQYVSYMFDRTQSMFRWENLPDTIPKRILELYLQINGNTCFYKYDDKLYVFTGGFGGEPDVYYMPTIYTIANPALKLSKSLIIDKDCVVMKNDAMLIGMLPMYEKYATALTEIDLSVDIAVVNSRILSLISAPDDRTKTSAEIYLQDVRKGKSGIIAENTFLEGIKTQPYASTGYTNTLTSLIEMKQYQRASWYNDIGLNANYNMKRESINSGESQLNNDMLFPLIDNMLECRKEGAEKVNRMYGTNIQVELESSWEDNVKEIEVLQDKMKEGDLVAEPKENIE